VPNGQETAIDGVRREERHRADEGIGEEKRFDRKRQPNRRIGARGEAPAEAGLEEEVHEHREEEDLREAPDPHEGANRSSGGDAAAGELGVDLLFLRAGSGNTDPERVVHRFHSRSFGGAHFFDVFYRFFLRQNGH
jgi:hypothetical protein